MDVLLLTLRLIHIVAGVLWVGIAVFTPFYVVPALEEAGTEAAGKVMGALQRRGIMTLIPALAGLNILSGAGLFWRVSGGSPAYFTSPTGRTLAFGALLALTAFTIGLVLARPALLKAGTLAQSLSPSATPEERSRVLELVARLRRRGARVGQAAGVLLLLAAASMAVARYM